MTLRTLRRSFPVLVLALAGSPARAGDGPFHREEPVPAGMPCKNCQKHYTRAGSDCPTCVNGKYGIGFRKRPTIPTLAPGACFGYFPTQWNKWEDVCPLPYPGAGINDPGTTTTARPTPTPPKADGKPATAPEPKPSSDAVPPADPKGTGGELPKPSTLPTVPDAPKGNTPPAPGVPMPNIPQVPSPGAGGAAPKGGKF